MQDAKPNMDDDRIETRVVKLELISTHTVKSLDTLQRRVDDGFKEVQAEFKEVRAEINANFRVIVALHITSLITLLGILAKSAKLF